MKMTDNEIKKAFDRLKKTKDFLRELYQEQVKKCPYPELKPLAKQTYEDNKNAFNIAIKAIEENTRQKAEIERLQKGYEVEATDNMLLKSENDELKAKLDMAEDYLNPLPFKNAYDEAIDKAKTEAYKEFAELVNNRLFKGEKFAYERDYIKNLVKELSEVSDNA